MNGQNQMPIENGGNYKELDGLRVLMFAPGFAPFAFSENIVNSKLALAFRNRGWTIDIISRIDEGPTYEMEWHEPWQTLKGSSYTLEYPLGNKLLRVIDLLYRLGKMRFPVEGLRWAGRALDKAMKLHKKKPYNLVLSRSPNDIGHVPALAFSRRFVVPWIANWNDPPAHLWPAPYNNSIGLLKKIISQNLLNSVLEHASVVTFPSKRLRDHVLRSTDSSATYNTQVVPHIGLTGYMQKVRNPNGCFRICHAGNLSRERRPEVFFDGVARFIERATMKNRFEIRILGFSSHELTCLAESKGLKHYLKMSGGLNYLDTLSELEQSDVLAVIEAPCKEGIFLPSKVTDYAQVGRPILAVSPENGTLADLIKETRCGEFASCNLPEAVADGCMALYQSWNMRNMKEDYPTNNLWELVRPESVMSKYEEMVSTLVS